MADPEREGSDQERETARREEERGERQKRDQRGKRDRPAVFASIIDRAEKLQETLKESELPNTEKRSLKRKLENIKGDGERKGRERKGLVNAIKELLEIIGLQLKLDEIEEKIVRGEVAEAWKESQNSLQKIQEAIDRGQLNRREATGAIEELLNEIKKRGEKIDNQTLRNKINQKLGELQDQIRETEVGEIEDNEEILNRADEIRGLTPEERTAADQLIQDVYTREPIFTKNDLEIITQYSRGPAEEKRAEDLVMEKVNEIFQVIDTNTEADWRQAMTIEDSIKLSIAHRALFNLGDWGERLSRKLMGENNLRRYLFTLNFGIERGGFKPDKLAEHMLGFTTDLRKTLFNIEGASTTARLWEMGFEKLLAHYDYVPYEEVVYEDGRSKLADWVRERFREHLRRSNPGLSEESLKELWPDWKVNRAISVGKGNGLATLRLVEIAARGKLPPEGSRMYSPWAEDYVRPMNPTEHLYGKFLQGGPGRGLFYYLLTGEKKIPRSAKEIKDSFEIAPGKWKDIGKGERRLIDLVNLFLTGGPWTNSTWRGEMAARRINGKTAEDLQHLGTHLSLILLKNRIQVYKEGTKEVDKEKTKEAQRAQFEKIWKGALKRDALQVVREAEIYDEPLRGLLEKILPDLEKKKREDYFKDIVRFPPDERMKHLVLLDFLKQTRPDGEWQRKWQEFSYDPEEKVEAWKRIETKEKRDAFLDKIENQYLLAREAMVSQIEKTGKDAEFDIDSLSDEVKDYLQSIERIAEFQFGPKKGDTILNSLVKRTLEKNGFRLGLGTSDTAWRLLHFTDEGQQALHRRHRDYSAAAEAVNTFIPMLWRFGEYQKNPLKFAEDLKELYVRVSEYDADIASDIAEKFAEGFIRACDGDLVIKLLPFPLDRLANMVMRNSYAEKTLGERARAFTAVDKRNLLNHLRLSGIFATYSDPAGIERYDRLCKKLGATLPRVSVEFLIKYGPLAIVFIFWQIWEEYKEKTEQAFK